MRFRTSFFDVLAFVKLKRRGKKQRGQSEHRFPRSPARSCVPRRTHRTGSRHVFFLHSFSGTDAAASALGFGDERDALRRSAEASWTRWDIDVLAAAGTLVHLCGPARWSWTHATRLGCPLPPDSSGGPPAQPRGALHDWFGNRESVVLRSPERHSIVLAFAAAGE